MTLIQKNRIQPLFDAEDRTVSELKDVQVPDIGDFNDVPVIEIFVEPGDKVEAEDPLMTLESDKATLDIPAPFAGTVQEIKVTLGTHVSEGAVLLSMETSASSAPADNAQDSAAATPEPEPDTAAVADVAPEPVAATTSGVALQVEVPDIGDFKDIPVIEILVNVGDQVAAEDPLVTLESDKATLDIPAPSAGTVAKIQVSLGDNVSMGSPILELVSTATQASTPEPKPESPAPVAQPVSEAIPEDDAVTNADNYPIHPGASAPDPRAPKGHPLQSPAASQAAQPQVSHATPAVRYFARELGVDITKVTGTGRKGRIVKQDVKNHIRQALTAPPASAATDSGSGIPAIPAVDFSKFGSVEEQPLSRIKKISGRHLQRAWLNVPHVTHHDEVDVTELESFRQSLKEEAAKQDLRVTSLTFILKALANALRAFPSFNSSLSANAESLILKHYVNIGIAVDTPNGLVVPVLRDVDQKSIFELAREMGEISQLARQGKLKPDQMQGGCMSISSLGGIGGTAFTPIVNVPEVAILGVTRARMQPVWDGKEFIPRLMLPLDLSYDHRVIDGAEAARFVAHLGIHLGDVRRLLL
jgi:pyruvate dehydrogenase E2 component (dihydrolipoamide acetyltransferase)